MKPRNRIIRLFLSASLLMLASAFAGSVVLATDWYVSSENGKGRKATKEKPAKDLGNIVSKLKPGDIVHIAGGTYFGKGKSGSTIITVPVSIIGGYDEAFVNRDPWGAYKTIFSGVNKNNKNWDSMPSVMIDLTKYREKEMPKILVDGIIVDHTGRNHYKTGENLTIVRKASPATGDMPTPDRGGLAILASKTGNFDKTWDITVQNCVVMNTAPSQGALTVSGYKGSKINIRNNIVINNTGYGILLGSKFAGSSNFPHFTVEQNTVLFTWKYDPFVQTMPGSGIGLHNSTSAELKNNLIGMSDRFAIDNAKRGNVLLTENLIMGNVEADYLEFDTRISLADLEDEAELLHEDSADNVADAIRIPVSSTWAKRYGSRVLIDRNVAEADIKVQATRANELRSILGLPLQAGKITTEESPVWLHALSVEDAIKAGSQVYLGKYGASHTNIR